jgi:hypothetical protein
MRTFKDGSGRTWTLAINVDAIKRVRGLIGVNLLEIIDGREGKLLERLMTDPVLLVDVVFAVCKPEADKAGVSNEDFGRSMAGDAIELATTALLEELVDFFPSRRDRQRLQKVLGRFWNLIEKVHDKLDARADDPAIQRKLDQALSELGGSSGSLPGSSASSPAP